MTEEQTTVIAIDGPAGAGKSSVARMLAKKLHIFYLDTGAMYRAFTYKLLELFFTNKSVPVPSSITECKAEVNTADIALHIESMLAHEDRMATLLREDNLEFTLDKDHLLLRIFLKGEDVTEKIRWPLVARFVSLVATSSIVRKVLVELQQEFGKEGSMVMEGRDIGSRVFPHTPFKFFITAGVKERANRRFKEMVKSGLKVNLEELETEIARRDKQDETRAESPLIRAEDALEIDTTHLTIEQVVEKISANIQISNNNRKEDNIG